MRAAASPQVASVTATRIFCFPLFNFHSQKLPSVLRVSPLLGISSTLLTSPNSTVPQPHWSSSTFTVDEKLRLQPERASYCHPRNQQGLCFFYQPQTPGGVGPARPCLHQRLTRFRSIHVARSWNLWSQVDRGVALFLPKNRRDFRSCAPQRRSTCIRPSRRSSIDTEFTYSSRSPCHLIQLRPPFIPEAQPPKFLTLTWHVFTMPTSLSTKILGLSLMAALGQAQTV
jgi:hypothetical protein